MPSARNSLVLKLTNVLRITKCHSTSNHVCSFFRTSFFPLRVLECTLLPEVPLPAEGLVVKPAVEVAHLLEGAVRLGSVFVRVLVEIRPARQHFEAMFGHDSPANGTSHILLLGPHSQNPEPACCRRRSPRPPLQLALRVAEALLFPLLTNLSKALANRSKALARQQTQPSELACCPTWQEHKIRRPYKNDKHTSFRDQTFYLHSPACRVSVTQPQAPSGAAQPCTWVSADRNPCAGLEPHVRHPVLMVSVYTQSLGS